MTITKISILLTLFIFGITIHAWGDPVKSIDHGANRKMIMKVDENKASLRKKTKLGKEPIKSLKEGEAKFQSGNSFMDNGAIINSIKVDVNFLKALEEKKKPRLRESLGKVICSYEVSQDAWRTKFLAFGEVTDTKFSNSDFRRSVLKSYPNGNDYFDEARKTIFKLLQSRREETFREISMGFRFSFNPVRGHMFLEMNVAPSPEIGPGIIIPF